MGKGFGSVPGLKYIVKQHGHDVAQKVGSRFGMKHSIEIKRNLARDQVGDYAQQAFVAVQAWTPLHPEWSSERVLVEGIWIEGPFPQQIMDDVVLMTAKGLVEERRRPDASFFKSLFFRIRIQIRESARTE